MAGAKRTGMLRGVIPVRSLPGPGGMGEHVDSEDKWTEQLEYLYFHELLI